MYVTSVQALVAGIGCLIINLVILKIAKSITEPVSGDAWFIVDEYEGRMFWLALGWIVSLIGTVVLLLIATSFSLYMLLISMALVAPYASSAARNATGLVPRPMKWSIRDVRSINWATLSLIILFIGVIDGISSENAMTILGLPLIYGAWFLFIYGTLRKIRTSAPS
jgi:hypothetical protein